MMSNLDKLRAKLHEIIFEADTLAGKTFDIVLIICILASVAVVMLDSVEKLHNSWHPLIRALEWLFTLLFTAEYLLRLFCVRKPLRYATSFFGIVDLLSIVPTYVSLFFPSSRYLIVIRTLRTIRIWRIMKLAHHVRELNTIIRALRASGRKITVFIVSLLCLVVILGSAMYMVESADSGFTSIPRGIYWAIVTLTTVGYGDISPKTGLGQFLAAVAMIMGYAIIAVPTGIVTVEIARAGNQPITTQACPTCSREGHDHDAVHCKFCGSPL